MMNTDFHSDSDAVDTYNVSPRLDALPAQVEAQNLRRVNRMSAPHVEYLTLSIPAGTSVKVLDTDQSRARFFVQAKAGNLVVSDHSLSAFLNKSTFTPYAIPGAYLFSGQGQAGSGSSWINRGVWSLPRNGTTAHTVDTTSSAGLVSGVPFTPTAGNFLVAILSASATSTTPAGWTLPAGGSAVGNTGTYVFTQTAGAGSNTFTTTHNGSNLPMLVTVYEFPAGSTFVSAVSATGLTAGGANPNLTGLNGSNTVFAVKAVTEPTGVTYTSTAWSGAPAPTENVDQSVPFAVTDGVGYSIAFLDGYTGLSFQPTGTMTTSGVFPGAEGVTFAVLPTTVAGASGSDWLELRGRGEVWISYLDSRQTNFQHVALIVERFSEGV